MADDEQGVHVIVTARRPEVLKEMEDMGMTGIALDVTNAESIAKCKEEVTELTGGKLDFLVNNAYGPLTRPLQPQPSPLASHPQAAPPPPFFYSTC